MKEEKISIYRVIPIISICLSVIGATSILFTINSKEFEVFLCAFFLVSGFLPILIFELKYERLKGHIGNNPQTTYKRTAIGFALAVGIMIMCSFFPAFFRPVLLIPLVLIAFSNEIIGITSAFVLNIILTLATGGTFYELLAYNLLIIIGGLLAKVLEHEKYRLHISIMFAFASIVISNMFFYLEKGEFPLVNLLYSFIIAVLIVLYSKVRFPKEKEITENDTVHSYMDFLEDNYVQVKAVRTYSDMEYCHARKVSDIAFKYAKELGLRAELSAAAGFYYRFNQWQEKKEDENFIQKARVLCFPDELIQILSEYYGEENLPSTPESALVHMIDGVLIKFELLENKDKTSKWDREVLIYQNLNDFSTSGLYDKSGLSINAFLKIREWLVKEELL